jgi:antitoxin ParD1/3/4
MSVREGFGSDNRGGERIRADTIRLTRLTDDFVSIHPLPLRVVEYCQYSTKEAFWNQNDFGRPRIMSSSINLSLTDELRRFIDRNGGNGGLCSTPSEFLREKKERQGIDALRDGVLQGYQDLIAGHTVEFTGDLRASLKAGDKCEDHGWR